FFLTVPRRRSSTRFPYTTLFRSGLPVANASLLDEATAAAEAMALTLAVVKGGETPRYLIDERCHPQTNAVVTTRAEARGVAVERSEEHTSELQSRENLVCRLLLE